MRRPIAAALFLVGLFPSLAVAQVPGFPQTLPASTVVGRLGIGSGPSQAIPFATLLPNVLPTPTRAGDVIYYNGSSWVALAGNNSGTSCLSETPAGVPTWASCGAGATPGGSNTNVQFNSSSAFGGSANLTWVSPALTIGVANSTTGQLKLTGATSGTVTVQTADIAGTWTFKVPATTGTVGQCLITDGTGITSWSGCGAVTGAALTKVDDTNVTLTLGGTPTTALLAASSLTLGWTGTLSGTRGGTGVNNGASLITVGGSVTFAGAFATTVTVTALTASTLPAGTHTLAGLDVAQTWSAVQQFNSGDLKLAGATSGLLTVNCAAVCGTNTLTFPAGSTDFSATSGVVQQATAGAAFTVGTVSGAFGGTGLTTAAIGDIIYASATTPTWARLADVATGSVLVSGGVSTAPAWSAAVTITTSLTTAALAGTTSTTSPLLIGGTGTTGTIMTLKTTTGVGTTDAFAFVGGSNGATTFATLATAGLIVTSAGSTALEVGRLGSTTPAFQVDASTATSITGIKVKSAATTGGVAISAIGETNVNTTIDAAGSGTLILQGTATGAITLTRATTASVSLTSPVVNLSGTSNQLVFQSAGVTGTLSWAPATSGKTITLPNGTTDFTATGGTSQVVKQVSTGAAFTVARLACADLSDSANGCSNSGANPSASIGLVVANGSATTYMRSDATPALSQSIAPSWTGKHTWTISTTSGAALAATVTQTTPNATDTADSAFNLDWTISAASATNELVNRTLALSATNTLTGGGALSNLRTFNLGMATTAGTTTTSAEGIYIVSGTAAGTVTTGYAIHIASWQGSTKWGIYDESGGNWYNSAALSVGTTTVAGTTGSILVNAYVQTGAIAVGSLPTCNSGRKGARYFVTDSNSTTFHATVANGGGNNVGVTCDGTNWYIS